MSKVDPGQYRAICFKEHGKQCEFCSEDKDVIVHHIDGDRANNTPDNLLPVCRKHHMNIHKRSEGFEEWHDKLLPPSQRTLTSKDEIYVPVDEATVGTIYELMEIQQFGTKRAATRFAVMNSLKYGSDPKEVEAGPIHTEVKMSETGYEQLHELMEEYGFETEESAIKGCAIAYLEDKQ